MRDKLNFEKNSRVGTLIVGIGILIILSAMIVLTFHSRKTSKIIDDNRDTIAVFKYQKKHEDSLDKEKLSRNDTIIRIVRNYIKIHHELNDTSKLKNNFYTDTIQQYFGDKNISFKQLSIIRNKKLLSRPLIRELVKYNNEDIHVNIINDTANVFLNLIYYKDSTKAPQELIYKIKFNKSNRIFFVKDYLPKAKTI